MITLEIWEEVRNAMPQETGQQESHAGAQHFCRIVQNRLAPERRRNVFVAGCGNALEASFICRKLDVPVTGTDIVQQWAEDIGTLSKLSLMEGNILNLPFEDGSFDVVFYHHVIEHVSDPAASLDELWRILAPGGLIYVGTPNRHRAIGYLGSPDATRREKVVWNVADYKARMRGKFRNEQGAHAGFTMSELVDLLKKNFVNVESLTAEYLSLKYAGKIPIPLLSFICMPPLIEVSAPSVYAVAWKAQRV